jgi:hypothetical protein
MNYDYYLHQWVKHYFFFLSEHYLYIVLPMKEMGVFTKHEPASGRLISYLNLFSLSTGDGLKRPRIFGEGKPESLYLCDSPGISSYRVQISSQ